jgi:TetR/AcrR family transcriptional regulator
MVLLDTTEQLMLAEGYAAITSRRVAKEAGVTPPLVHYYFPGLDDLFLAVFRRRADEQLDRQAEALRSDQPLRALWRFSSDRSAAAFTTEFMALANHRKTIRAEIARYVERFRVEQVDALTARARAGLLDTGDLSVPGIVLLLTNAARSLASELALGLDAAHADAQALVDEFLDRVEPQPVPARKRAPARKVSR